MHPLPRLGRGKLELIRFHSLCFKTGRRRSAVSTICQEPPEKVRGKLVSIASAAAHLTLMTLVLFSQSAVRDPTQLFRWQRLPAICKWREASLVLLYLVKLMEDDYRLMPISSKSSICLDDVIRS